MFKRFCWKPIYSLLDLLVFAFMCITLILVIMINSGFQFLNEDILLVIGVIALLCAPLPMISAFKTHKYYEVIEKE